MSVNDLEVFQPGELEIGHNRVEVTPELAYRTYVMGGMRSLRTTAALLGIPEGTVLSWSTRHKWRTRVRDGDLEVAEGIAEASAFQLVSQQLRNIQALASIRDDHEAPTRDRVEAAKVLMNEFGHVARLASANVLSGRSADDDDEIDLAELAKTPEGVRQLLEIQRKQTGR